MGITKQQLLNTVEQLKVYNDENTKIVNDRIEQLISSKQVIDSKLSFCLYGGDSNISRVPHTPNQDITEFLIKSKYINEGIVVNTEESCIELKAGHTYKLEAFIWSYYDGTTDTVKMHFWSWYNKTSGELLGVTSCHQLSSSIGISEPTVAIIQVKEDMKVGIKSTDNVSTKSWNINIYNHSSYICIEEIGRAMEIDPLDYVNKGDTGIEDSPVGQIIPFMGTIAPAHYLICDGSEYSIKQYPHLAEHFKTQFGSYKYFGGNGTTTFAVPDLRNEFIRGYRGESPLQYSGDIGKHQDGTYIKNTNSYVSESVAYMLMSSRDVNGDWEPGFKNADEHRTKISPNIIDPTMSQAHTSNNIAALAPGNTTPVDFLARPTNVAVLYCIKYEPTYYMNVVSYGYEKETVFDGKLIVGDHEIPSLEKYDFVQVYGTLSVDDASGNHNHKSSLIIHRDDILKTDTTLVNAAFILCASPGIGTTANRRIGFGFSDYTHINIGDISGGGYICTIYGYKRKNEIEKADNKETQSIIITGKLGSKVGDESHIPYPAGYDSTNCIIRSVNLLGLNGYFSGTRSNLDYQVQLSTSNISLLVEGINAVDKEVVIELAKKNSIVDSTVYSTEETPIGTWVDGKTIYRKVVSFGDIDFSSATLISADFDTTELDTVISFRGTAERIYTSGNEVEVISLPNANFSSANSIIINRKTNKITVSSNTTSIKQYNKVYIFVEYTKK